MLQRVLYPEPETHKNIFKKKQRKEKEGVPWFHLCLRWCVGRCSLSLHSGFQNIADRPLPHWDYLWHGDRKHGLMASLLESVATIHEVNFGCLTSSRWSNLPAAGPPGMPSSARATLSGLTLRPSTTCVICITKTARSGSGSSSLRRRRCSSTCAPRWRRSPPPARSTMRSVHTGTPCHGSRSDSHATVVRPSSSCSMTASCKTSTLCSLLNLPEWLDLREWEDLHRCQSVVSALPLLDA